ncbi:MAG: hypothetical protein JWR72_402 [Flavisolibacter sp.]|nr:hypothetical protein [Flavisolibacter sp.]
MYPVVKPGSKIKKGFLYERNAIAIYYVFCFSNQLNYYYEATLATLRCRCATLKLLFGSRVVCHPDAGGIIALHRKRLLRSVNLAAVFAYNV